MPFREPYNLLYILLLISVILNYGCFGKNLLQQEINIQRTNSDFLKFYGIEDNIQEKVRYKNRTKSPTAIVIHTSDEYKVKDYFNFSIQNGFFFHVFIDKNGTIYNENFFKEFRLTPKMDSYAIHLVFEGKESDIISDEKYLAIIRKYIKELSDKFSIPLDNKDISSEKGIFTHTQSKKKFGNFVDMRECGGEKLLSSILNQINGKYFPEIEWKDRFTKEWTFRREDPKFSKGKEEFTNGRSITENPITPLLNVERLNDGHIPEDYRVKYVFDEMINPTCVVLHFTALPDFKTSMKVLEERRVNATIMVDKDGKAYQLLDSLYHSPRTAGGTNTACVQIEIVGRNTEELLKNEVQTQKVILLVKELTNLFSIPITNYKIESLSGVFSHTQAKKKFGRSVALVGKDFDPGEDYMKRVIEGLGAKYYKEEEWFERTSENWIILYGEFQP